MIHLTARPSSQSGGQFAEAAMLFKETPLGGAFVLEPQKHADERGFFARTFCRDEFLAHGLNPNVAQSSLSYNRLRGTLRGMHYQASPHAEAKQVRCTAGRIFDVIVDLREDSPTRHQWFGIELSAANRLALYVPEYFAHGFQALEDDTQVLYDISVAYVPDAARGFHHASPLLGIEWPVPVSSISERDQNLSPLS